MEGVSDGRNDDVAKLVVLLIPVSVTAIEGLIIDDVE